jgi:hypothetical protein
VNKVLRTLEDAKVVVRSRDSVEVLDRTALRRYAE